MKKTVYKIRYKIKIKGLDILNHWMFWDIIQIKSKLGH